MEEKMAGIEIGMMVWFEKNTPLVEAVSQAAAMHEKKCGVVPDLCYAALEWGLEESLVINGMRVIPERSVLEQHLYVGRKNT